VTSKRAVRFRARRGRIIRLVGCDSAAVLYVWVVKEEIAIRPIEAREAAVILGRIVHPIIIVIVADVGCYLKIVLVIGAAARSPCSDGDGDSCRASPGGLRGGGEDGLGGCDFCRSS